MKKRFRWMRMWVGTGVGITLIIVFLSAIARRPATKWYTSPPLDAQGTRVKFQIPFDWKVDPVVMTSREYFIYANSPVEQSFTLPLGRRIPWKSAAPAGGITVSGRLPVAKPSSPFEDLDTNHWAYTAVGGSSLPADFPMFASRQLRVKPDADPLDMSYADSDHAQFERLNRVIMDSLTVLP